MLGVLLLIQLFEISYSFLGKMAKIIVSFHGCRQLTETRHSHPVQFFFNFMQFLGENC